jgi:histidinol-phosphate aminotransferase
MLVVDEAYAEFDFRAHTLAILAERRGPWTVTRTFSKAYALAGLRVGYVLCSSPGITEILRAARPIFEMTSPALAAAKAALMDTDHLDLMLRTIRAGREQLVAGIRALGFSPYLTVANFVTTDIGFPAAPLIAGMAARGVLVRGLNDPGFDNFLRITVGLPEENEQALAALDAALNSLR